MLTQPAFLVGWFLWLVSVVGWLVLLVTSDSQISVEYLFLPSQTKPYQTTQPPNHPTTQPPNHPTTEPTHTNLPSCQNSMTGILAFWLSGWFAPITHMYTVWAN
jgi:hypothetical protein